ncbi:hypothetical protein GCM10011339_33770 [Echinicola rosea]|uniref:Uncharacterized protein n=1 Tax=Echinicola rosea TaxID=1807691 RepID=A0ABQ1V7G3_9BACT|nr:hypothetical protein GCM10011339_33770 [Echinicola rosea]
MDNFSRTYLKVKASSFYNFGKLSNYLLSNNTLLETQGEVTAYDIVFRRKPKNPI